MCSSSKRLTIVAAVLLAWAGAVQAACTQKGDVAATSTQIVAADDISTGRSYLMIQNTGTANPMEVAIGSHNAATVKDIYLAPGASWVMTLQQRPGGVVLVPSGDVAAISASTTTYAFCDW